MKKKIISLILVGAMSASLLVGCGEGNENNLPKEGTEVAATTTKDNTEVVDDTTGTEVVDGTEVVTDNTDTDGEKLPEGTYIRESAGAAIKEAQNDDGTSVYQISYKDESGRQLNFTFDGIANIGSWNEEEPEQGVWRYIYNGDWVTVAVWSCGNVNGGKLITKASDDDINKLMSEFKIDKDAKMEKIDEDKYCSVVIKADRKGTDIGGYVTIIDDKTTQNRWLIQYLGLNDSADYDMLHKMAKSTAISSDFTYDSIDSDKELSSDPFTVTVDKEGNIQAVTGDNLPEN